MFGFIWAAISGIAVASDEIKGSIRDSRAKDKARYEQLSGRNDSGTYYDHNGKLRDIETNQLRMIITDTDTGELWLTDVHLKKIKNLSEERRLRERKTIGKDPLHTVIKHSKGYTCCDDQVWNKGLCRYEKVLRVVGYRYQDIETGRIYVERHFDNISESKFGTLTKWPNKIEALKGFNKRLYASFYMDIETGELVRVSDRSIQWEEKAKDKTKRLGEDYIPMFDIDECERFIKIFNQYQKMMREKYDLSERDEFNDYFWNYYEY